MWAGVQPNLGLRTSNLTICSTDMPIWIASLSAVEFLGTRSTPTVQVAVFGRLLNLQAPSLKADAHAPPRRLLLPGRCIATAGPDVAIIGCGRGVWGHLAVHRHQRSVGGATVVLFLF